MIRCPEVSDACDSPHSLFRQVIVEVPCTARSYGSFDVGSIGNKYIQHDGKRHRLWVGVPLRRTSGTSVTFSSPALARCFAVCELLVFLFLVGTLQDARTFDANTTTSCWSTLTRDRTIRLHSKLCRSLCLDQTACSASVQTQPFLRQNQFRCWQLFVETCL